MIINDEVSHTIAKSILEDIDLALRHEKSLRRGSLIWDGMGHKKRLVHDRYLRIIQYQEKQLTDALEMTTCAGCGDFYDEFGIYNTTHDDMDCRIQAYRNGKESEDSRV